MCSFPPAASAPSLRQSPVPSRFKFSVSCLLILIKYFSDPKRSRYALDRIQLFVIWVEICKHICKLSGSVWETGCRKTDGGMWLQGWFYSSNRRVKASAAFLFSFITEEDVPGISRGAEAGALLTSGEHRSGSSIHCKAFLFNGPKDKSRISRLRTNTWFLSHSTPSLFGNKS